MQQGIIGAARTVLKVCDRKGSLKKLLNEVYEDGQDNAKQDHGDNGKIEPKVLLFYADIARKPPKPLHFIVKIVDQDANEHHTQPYKYDIFTRIGIHCCKFKDAAKTANVLFMKLAW